MTKSIYAHFDGSNIVPDEPLQLPAGQRLRVILELEEKQTARFADILDCAADLPDVPADLAHQHDHYLYGTPKK
jgi:hypothetical protein